MVKTVQASIIEEDKLFILAFKDVVPDWSIYNFEDYPSIKWKQLNLEKIKASNPIKHKELLYQPPINWINSQKQFGLLKRFF